MTEKFDQQPKPSSLFRRIFMVALIAIGSLIAVVVFFPGKEGAVGEHDHQAGETHQYWTCGMHPWVVLPDYVPCPICGMDLVPLDPAKFSGEVTIDPVVVQNMGVRVEEVTSGPLVKTIRTVGIIEYNEKTVRDINTKVSGWIEDLYIDSLGAKVEAGAALFSLYSPQLYSAQEDFLIAAKSQRSTSSSDLLTAARTRLEYFDISEAQIKALQQRGKPLKAIDVKSPFSGVVIAKHANEGMKVDPGMQVFRIADLSKVWVLVTVYEYQLPFVQNGQDAVMTLPYIPGKTFTGKVVYVYPYLDKKTREAQVRLEFDNSDGLLKPGMFASVELRNQLAEEKVLVPRAAVIDTGARQVAFVSLGEGRFEPRNVRMGVSTDDSRVEVIQGLAVGEIVVTSGQFLLDSEANMRESLAKMVRGDSAADQQVKVASEGQSQLSLLPAALSDAISKALDSYIAIQKALAADTLDGVVMNAGQFITAFKAMQTIEIAENPHFWHQQAEILTTVAQATENLQRAVDLAGARLALGNLSPGFESVLLATGVPSDYQNEVQVLHCPMVQSHQGGATWLQSAGSVANPYMGAAMLECFDERKALPVTGGDKE